MKSHVLPIFVDDLPGILYWRDERAMTTVRYKDAALTRFADQAGALVPMTNTQCSEYAATLTVLIDTFVA